MQSSPESGTPHHARYTLTQYPAGETIIGTAHWLIGTVYAATSPQGTMTRDQALVALHTHGKR